MLTNPFDVVKTQRQVGMTGGGSGTRGAHGSAKAPSLFAALARSFRDGSCFAGMAPRLIRVAPACGIALLRGLCQG